MRYNLFLIFFSERSFQQMYALIEIMYFIRIVNFELEIDSDYNSNFFFSKQLRRSEQKMHKEDKI